MGFTEDFRACANTKVIWRALVSRDEYNKPTYEPQGVEDIPARVFKKHREIRDRRGEVVASTAQAWLFADLPVEPDDQIELENGTCPDIVAVNRPTDEKGQTHVKVFFR